MATASEVLMPPPLYAPVGEMATPALENLATALPSASQMLLEASMAMP